MKRIITFVGLVLVMGGVGFAAGQYFAPKPEVVGLPDSQRETLYKLPLGEFTVQVVKPERFFNIYFELEVFVAGASNFERLYRRVNRSRMRAEVTEYLSTMVETSLWVDEVQRKDLDGDELAMRIARNLYQTYPMVRSARLVDLATSRVERSDL